MEEWVVCLVLLVVSVYMLNNTLFNTSTPCLKGWSVWLSWMYKYAATFSLNGDVNSNKGKLQTLALYITTDKARNYRGLFQCLSFYSMLSFSCCNWKLYFYQCQRSLHTIVCMFDTIANVTYRFNGPDVNIKSLCI